MTQYDDEVTEHKLKMEAEEWGKTIKYIHASSGIIETAYNNGVVHYEENKPNGKKWTEGEPEATESLLKSFSTWIADQTWGRHGK